MNYRFEIFYATQQLEDVSNFMKSMDLEIEFFCAKEIICFSCKKKHSIAKLKEIITKAYESLGCKVHRLEGGGIE